MKFIVALLGGLLTFAAAPLIAEPPTLFERVGGRDTLAAIADDYVDTIVMDATMHENPHIAEASEMAPRDYMKAQIAIMLCERSGGPCTHRTRPMGEAMAPMRFRTKDWERARALFQRTVEAHGVTGAEAKGLLEIFGMMRPHFLQHDR